MRRLVVETKKKMKMWMEGGKAKNRVNCSTM